LVNVGGLWRVMACGLLTSRMCETGDGLRPVNVPQGGTGDACGWGCPAGWVKTGGEVTDGIRHQCFWFL